MLLCRHHRNVPCNLWTLTLVTFCLCSYAVSADVERGPSEEKLQRFTRSDGVSFNKNEVKSATTVYNALRGHQKAADMRIMRWLVDLRMEAQSYVSHCDYTRAATEFQGGGTSVRGYVYRGSSRASSTAMRMWQADVRKLFGIKATCKKTESCNDLKKVIQSRTENLGCAKKYCRSISNHPKYKSGHFIACLHNPAAAGGRPFLPGASCSRCPAGYNYCIRGLCSEKESEKLMGSGATRYPNTSVMVAMVMVVLSWTLSHDRTA